MKLRCIIIDDEPLARKGLAEYVAQVDFLELVGLYEDVLSVDHFSSGVDLVFLDIELPSINGVAFLRSLEDPPLVIFITAYPEYALEGYELNVVDYLLKPVAFARFFKAVNKAREILESKMPSNQTANILQQDHFFVKENSRFTRIRYDEVLYIEALQNYVSIHLEQKKILSYITLTMMEKELPASLFMRVHKSFIVALSRVSVIDGNKLLIGNDRIPFSRSIKEELRQKLLQHKLLKRS